MEIPFRALSVIRMAFDIDELRARFACIVWAASIVETDMHSISVGSTSKAPDSNIISAELLNSKK
jgi:hypothetical protein